LGIIAKNGLSTETRIASLGKRRTILSRDIIRRRLLVTDLSSDFLSVKIGDKIGNLPEKREKIYSLTFKGFLASLAETSIQENFWVKNYVKTIKKKSDTTVAEIFLNHIHYMVGTFLVLHSRRRGLLTQDNDMEEDFFDYYFVGSTLHNLIRMRIIKKTYTKHKEFFIHCVIQFFVSCDVLGTLIMNASDKDGIINMYNKINSYNRSLEDIITDWMWSMFTSSNKISKFNLEKQNGYEPITFIKILGGQDTMAQIRSFARDELRRIKPKRKFHEHSLLRKSGLDF